MIKAAQALQVTGLLALFALPLYAALSPGSSATGFRFPASVGAARAPNHSAFAPVPEAPAAPPGLVILGRGLFRERLLSADNTVACASCHNDVHGGADTKALSIGVEGRQGEANAPTVYNSALNFRQFWDGRATTLEEQLEGPIHNSSELATSWEQILKKLNGDPGWSGAFRHQFGTFATRENVTAALVAYERSLVTPNSPFDRFLMGEEHALSPEQKRGFAKFQSFGCVACHQGVNLGGNMFQTLGLMGNYFRDRGGRLPSDEGRYRVTRDPSDLHVFRVPGLRNVELTPPYFHDGSAPTLEDAVRKMARYQLGRTLTEEEARELAAFLRSLTGEAPESASAKAGR